MVLRRLGRFVGSREVTRSTDHGTRPIESCRCFLFLALQRQARNTSVSLSSASGLYVFISLCAFYLILSQLSTTGWQKESGGVSCLSSWESWPNISPYFSALEPVLSIGYQVIDCWTEEPSRYSSIRFWIFLNTYLKGGWDPVFHYSVLGLTVLDLYLELLAFDLGLLEVGYASNYSTEIGPLPPLSHAAWYGGCSKFFH